jgi:hypothetical protein
MCIYIQGHAEELFFTEGRTNAMRATVDLTGVVELFLLPLDHATWRRPLSVAEYQLHAPFDQHMYCCKECQCWKCAVVIHLQVHESGWKRLVVKPVTDGNRNMDQPEDRGSWLIFNPDSGCVLMPLTKSGNNNVYKAFKNATIQSHQHLVNYDTPSHMGQQRLVTASLESRWMGTYLSEHPCCQLIDEAFDVWFELVWSKTKQKKKACSGN